MQTTTFSAPDIVCDGCARSIQNALSSVSGVQNVAVDIAAKQVQVTHDVDTAPAQTLIDVLDDAGFSATTT